jgi:hypothetical protein
MKIIALATILAAASMPAHAAYGWEATKSAVSCTGTTISEAAKGDFSHWALPWSGKNLRAGQWVDENCQVRG